MTTSTIKLSGVTKAFGDVEALRGVTLEVMPGELFGILGPSGCGKSTLLNAIVGFVRPDQGSIVVAGKTFAGGGSWVPPERRRVGMVVQDYALFPHLTVARNVAFGLKLAPRDKRAARVQEVLDLVGLQHKAKSYPDELSGGESQRVALARALAPEPDVILMDEPFSSLDATLRADIRRDVQLILQEAGATAVLVTHDQEEALSISDRLAVMREGRIVQVGDPELVYREPAERWVAQFVGEVNILPGILSASGVRTDLGTFEPPTGGGAYGKVHIAVRPEQLEMSVDPMGNAEITEREFRGHDVLYRLRHESGKQLLVQLPSLELRAVGARVFVRPGKQLTAALVD